MRNALMPLVGRDGQMLWRWSINDMVVRAKEEEAPATGCLFDWTTRGSGGVQVGWSCAMANDPSVNTSVEPGEWPQVAEMSFFRLGHLLPEEHSTVRPCSCKSGTPPITFRLQCGSRPRSCSHDEGVHGPIPLVPRAALGATAIAIATVSHCGDMQRVPQCP